MSENTTINQGQGGDVIATEDTGLGYKIPVSKIRTGALDVDGGDVTASNPFPVGGVSTQTGAVVAPDIDPANNSNRLVVSAPELLEAVEENSRLLRALLRGIAVLADVSSAELEEE